MAAEALVATTVAEAVVVVEVLRVGIVAVACSARCLLTTTIEIITTKVYPHSQQFTSIV